MVRRIDEAIAVVVTRLRRLRRLYNAGRRDRIAVGADIILRLAKYRFVPKGTARSSRSTSSRRWARVLAQQLVGAYVQHAVVIDVPIELHARDRAVDVRHPVGREGQRIALRHWVRTVAQRGNRGRSLARRPSW